MDRTTFFGVVVAVAIAAGVICSIVLRPNLSKNATSAAFALKTLIEAQEVYHKEDRDGDGRKEYAFTMAELARVKLLPEELAVAEISNPKCKPYNGYVFRILTAQGPQAPGGSKLWTDPKGELTYAHGGAAFPFAYQKTGKDSFVISSAGTIFQMDLSEAQTHARDILIFDPPPWHLNGGEH